MLEKSRVGWVKYPASVYLPRNIYKVEIIGFAAQTAYHNPESPNYDVSAEIKAICIDTETGKYEEVGLYFLFDKEPTD